MDSIFIDKWPHYIINLMSNTELVRQSGEVTSLPGGSYITSPADRDGFTLRCTDQENDDWPVEGDKVKIKEIRPICESIGANSGSLFSSV